MKISTRRNKEVKIGNKDIETVDKFTYLGSIVSPSGGTDESVDARINKARAAITQFN